MMSQGIATEPGSKPSRRLIFRALSTSGLVRRLATCARFARWGDMTMLEASRRYVVIAAIGLASVAAFATFAVDPPDVHVNVMADVIETVDATWSGSNYNVRYTQTTSDGEQTASFLLTTNAANDADPRIFSAESGDS